MDSQSTNNSPFSNSVSSPASNHTPSEKQAEDFVIHTMQDDLASFKGAINEERKIVEEKKPVSPAPAKTPFSEPKASLPSKPFETKEPIRKSPFNDEEDLLPVAPAKISQPKAVLPISNIEPIPENKSEDGVVNKLMISTLIILLICASGFGIYYFYLKTTQKESVEKPIEAPIAVEPVKPAEESVVPEPIAAPVEKYSTASPNYLVIDAAKAPYAEIMTKLESTANEISAQTSQGPYEFIIVGEDNSQINFPIFAAAAKLNFSQKTFTYLENNFSLYFYKDGTEMRLALSLNTPDKAALETEITKQEKLLVESLGTLFLSVKPEIKTNIFGTGSYNSNTIHYLNLNSTQTLSIDYAFTTKKLFIGTSKNTLRAVLDKDSQPVLEPYGPANMEPPVSATAPTNSVTDNITIPITAPASFQPTSN